MDDQPTNSRVVDQLAEEFVERYRRGERPKVSDYVANYPQHAEQIRDLFPALVMMEDVAPGKLSDDVDSLTADVVEQPLESLGDYRILREVGRGGMGVVYEAEQVSLCRHVALKVLTRQTLLDARQKLRFQREAKAAAKLHHTNIVPVFGVGEHDGIDYYVMQFIHGLALDDVLDELRRFARDGALPTGRSSGDQSVGASEPSAAEKIAKNLVSGTFGAALEANPAKNRSRSHDFDYGKELATARLSESATSSSVVLPGQSSASKFKSNYWQSVARIGIQVGEALEYAHRQGVIHRDIKPGNLLLDSNGTVWVTDFGLAKADDQQNLTDAGDVLGTLRYMAPEMFSGKADARSDVYALGLTLYELLTLRPAFDESDRHELVRKLTSETPKLLRRLSPSVPRDLETITNKAIDPNSAHRYQTARELAEDLQRFLNDEPIRAQRITSLGRTWRWCKRSPAVATLSGVILAMLAMLAVGGPLAALRQGSLAEKANQSEKQSRRYLYVAHMNMVQQAWETADRARVRRLLSRYLPKPGEEDLRGFEWYYWWRLSHQFRSPFVHDDVVWRAVFSPNGELLASCSSDMTVKVWDVASSTPLHILTGHRDVVRYVAFSPDGKTLASAGSDKTVKLWDVASGVEKRTISGHQNGVLGLAFSPLGDRLASAGGDTVRLWDTMTGEATHAINVGSPVECIAFSPDGTALVSGSRGRAVELWDAATGQRKARLGGHRGRVMSVAFSHDGAALASADSVGEIKVWDTTNNKENMALRGHKFFVMSVTFSPDGTTLASAGTDNTVRFWDLSSGREKTSLKGHDYLVNSVAFSPDGKLLASASHDKTTRLWDVDLENMECETLEGHKSTVWSVAYSPDGTTLASGGQDETVRLWDVATGEEIAMLGRHEGGVYSVALSPDGKRAASSGSSGILKVWDVSNRREERSLQERIGEIRAVAFSPDGKTLAAGGGTGTVQLWDTTTWTTTEIPQAHAAGVLCVAFSPDGETLATGGRDEAVRLWDLGSGREKRTLRAAGSVFAVAFSPDGELVASSHAQAANETIRIWDVASGTESHSMKGHTWIVNSLSFSPDGKSLASASWDFTIKLWNVATGEVTTTLNHTSHARCVAFSPDGYMLVSGGSDAMRLWRARSPETK